MIVIGDVHGCYETLMRLIDKLPKDEKICFVGDLIDRGSKSKNVVDFVISNNYQTVTGNHCDMMVSGQGWFQNGAKQTIESYGLKTEHYYNLYRYPTEKKAKFIEHKEWMKTLPLYIIFDEAVDKNGNKLMVSHSSVGDFFGQSDWLAKEHILWNRDYNPKPIEGIYNVYGHTPVKEPWIKEHYAVIDTGAVFKNKLTALRYPEMEVFQQDFVD